MKNKDKAAWRAKNLRLNKDVEVILGMRLVDDEGNHGVVVKIIPHNPENPIEEHGTVYVWQEDRMGYGGDNCEHYCHNNWHEFLRIV